MGEPYTTVLVGVWKEFAKMRKRADDFLSVLGKNKHGQAFSEVRRFTIE
jgi:hypothetical protein